MLVITGRPKMLEMMMMMTKMTMTLMAMIFGVLKYCTHTHLLSMSFVWQAKIMHAIFF